MQISATAQRKLNDMISRLPSQAVGFCITGVLGTCRGSTPVLEPVEVEGQSADIVEIMCEPVRLFVIPEYAEILKSAELDYDASFMGRGLVMTWEHQEACPCHWQM
ncbi:MAG: hypothetical protein R6V56_02435 [Lentisphaeria bacterium]